MFSVTTTNFTVYTAKYSGDRQSSSYYTKTQRKGAKHTMYPA